jgi:hypothetical protein
MRTRRFVDAGFIFPNLARDFIVLIGGYTEVMMLSSLANAGRTWKAMTAGCPPLSMGSSGVNRLISGPLWEGKGLRPVPRFISSGAPPIISI